MSTNDILQWGAILAALLLGLASFIIVTSLIKALSGEDKR